MAGNWYDNHTKVAAFAQVLEDAGVLDPEDTRTYKKFLNEPFKYDEIYSAWEDLNFPTQDDEAEWTEFVKLLEPEEEEEEEEE